MSNNLFVSDNYLLTFIVIFLNCLNLEHMSTLFYQLYYQIYEFILFDLLKIYKVWQLCSPE